MNVERVVQLSAVTAFAEAAGQCFAPAAASARHVHLSEQDVAALFGSGYVLTRLRDLSQPGQFAANERVEVHGPRGKLAGVRVLGPTRSETQVELSVTDAMKLGIKPEVRMSGDLAGTPGAVLVGPAGSVTLRGGVIVAARHLHISPAQAALFGLADGDVVSMGYEGVRSGVLENIAVRSGKGHDLELHLDTDEANALLLKNGDLLQIFKGTRAAAPTPARCAADNASALSFIGEWEVKQAAKEGQTCLTLSRGGIITPLARDTARELRIEVRV